MWTRWYDLDRSMQWMDEFRRRMDRLFEEAERGGWGVGLGPRMALFDEEEAFVVVAEVPGMAEKDIHLTLQKDTLTLTGERMAEVPKGYTVHRQERLPIQFTRSVTLPGHVDANEVTAQVKDGLLTVRIAKAPESRPRQIAVEAD